MTIPASAIVSILPGAIGAGGNALVLNGVMLVHNYRVPTGVVMSFATPLAVGQYFGMTSGEYAKALVYFGGYTLCTQLPGALLIARATDTDTGAWLLTGPVSSLSIAQLQGITGTLTITMDNYAHIATSFSLAAATSYTAAATLIATAINTTEPTESSFTGSIAAGTPAIFLAEIAEDVMTVTSVTSGVIEVGSAIGGTGVTAGTVIASQQTGTPGGIGTYGISIVQSVPPGTTITGTNGLLTVTAITTGTLSVGQTITGGTTAAGTVITALGTGTGLTGTYFVNKTQIVTSGTLTGVGSTIAVTYDSVSGGFLFTSGITGAPSTAAYATGTMAAQILATQALGATLSQGANGLTPSAVMTGISQITQNWASFFTLFDPDDGQGNAQKLAYAQWTSQQNSRYAYMMWDTDITPTLSNAAASSAGYIIDNTDLYNGTSCWYDPNNEGLAAFQSGIAACLNFGAINGRTTFAFREQPGMVATVTNQQIGANLLANGYNFYGAYATANQQFVWNYNGSISGQFLWLDSYMNQIWMNSQFQLALMELLQSVNSIPYNVAGYGMIAAALSTVIQEAISFGAIRTGIPLSATEAITVNSQAGVAIDQILTTQGWYIQVQPASAQVRAARTSPTCYFWYTDGQSIQQITLSSLEII